MVKSYSKSLNYSYTLGVYSTLELLESHPGNVQEVVMDEKGLSNTGLLNILEICKEVSIKVTVSPNTVKKLAKSENSYCLGVFNKYYPKLEKHKNHLVLVNPSDMGNLGTILRTALAFDMLDVALIKPACEIFDPKVIRSSMGALFKVRFEYFDNLSDYLNRFENHLYTFRTNAKSTINDCRFRTPCSLIFGNEGSGLPEEFDHIGEGVKIPQSNNVDSLNLSVAVGIALHNLSIT